MLSWAFGTENARPWKGLALDLFNVNRLGGKESKSALEKEPVFVKQGIEFLLFLQ
jgi:hypothetical protein